MARTRKQKWLIGCLSAAGVLVVLSGLALAGFLMFMKWLRTVPPESTQVVLYNDTNERLRIDRVIYGKEEMFKDRLPILAVHDQNKFTQDSMTFFVMQPEMSINISITYTGMDSGRQQSIEIITHRIPGRPCKFVAFLRKEGGKVSSCGYNELQDFEDD
jgi:hypothetical protein